MNGLSPGRLFAAMLAICVVFAGSQGVSSTASAIDQQGATADPPSSATAAQVDALLEDIKAHKHICADVKPGDPAYLQCSNERTALAARQKRLGVSNDMVNSQLKSRGWRWP